MSSRRDFVKQGGLLGLVGLVGSNLASAKQNTPVNNFNTSKWADGSRLVVSVSMLNSFLILLHTRILVKKSF